MRILLNCFPPLEVSMPDLGLSVLKQYLSQRDVDCDILYWNILLYDYSKEIVPINTSSDTSTIFMPYLFYLNNGFSEEMRLLLQTKNPSWTLLDANYYERYVSNTSDKIRKFINNVISEKKIDTYDVIGISYKFSQWISALVFIRELKKRNSNIKIVIGGIPSKIEALKFVETFYKDIDFAIWGEGEASLYKLIQFLQQSNNSSAKLPINIHSLVYKNQQSEVIANTCLPVYSEMVIPDYTDFVNQYNIENIRPILNIENSRGCYWNKCTFCYLNEGYKFRRKTNKQVLESIHDIVDKYKIGQLFFNDNDLCGGNMEQFESLLDLLIIYNKNSNVSFIVGEFNSKKLNKNIIEKISLAGFKMIQIGVEALSDKKLKKIEKHASFINHLLSFKFCYKYGLVVTGSNLITGFPDDDIQDVIDAVKNLHYLRFFFKFGLTIRVIDLCVKATSKYFSNMDEKDRNNLHSDLSMLVANEHVQNNKFYFFEHVNLGKKGLWIHFTNVLNFYNKNNFSYRVYPLKDEDVVFFQYKEYFNDKEILNIVFNELEWFIIEECSNEIINMEELISRTIHKYSNILPTEVMSIVKDLNKERLLYIDNYTEEIFCIIDADLKTLENSYAV
ncbi:MAG: radical domain protein [Bacteroidetes bacterium]|nr:radical domain protein [Bacteroidota bacterium]